jgi:hypothetical protein
MKIDTPVFEAMRSDTQADEDAWTALTGTREAIQRDGLTIDIHSLSYFPHEWLNSRGYLDCAEASIQLGDVSRSQSIRVSA